MSKQEKKLQKEQQKLKELNDYNDSIEKIRHNENDFICPICLNYIVSAVSLKCGHSFCEQCLHEYFLYFKNCQICEKSVRKFKFAYCFILDQMIHEFIRLYHKEELQKYEQAVKDNKEWRKLRQIGQVEVGMQLDVRDPNFVWKVGTIKRFKVAQDTNKYFVIHYNGLSEKHDEEIIESSPRLANLGFYSNRKDIPKYFTNTTNPFLKNKLYIECFDTKNINKQVFIDEETSDSD